MLVRKGGINIRLLLYLNETMEKIPGKSYGQYWLIIPKTNILAKVLLEDC